MPLVQTNVQIVGVPRQVIWDTLIDFEAYPSFMDDVVSVEYIRRDSSSAESAWSVLLNGSELRWIERDDFRRLERIDFVQIEGDIEIWQGFWEICDAADGFDVRLQVEFDIGIPSLSDILNPIGARAIKANCRRMLTGLQSRSMGDRQLVSG
jgi:ribosome-associated toxin RatA of RatAB toxin-antitoxin module